MKYGSPCAVIARYVHVRAAQSRKRNVSFAKLSGFCKICNAVHKYEIDQSPFDETANSADSVSTIPIKDLHVTVTVDGSFYLKDGQPDITQPVHPSTAATGLDLRGEERHLLAMKASMEGAKSVYLEGMAFAQKDQIESYNRTSIR